MCELSVREMRAGYGAITEALDAEGELILTHHGKPFAKVVPLTSTPAPALPKARRASTSRAEAPPVIADAALGQSGPFVSSSLLMAGPNLLTEDR